MTEVRLKIWEKLLNLKTSEVEETAFFSKAAEFQPANIIKSMYLHKYFQGNFLHFWKNLCIRLLENYLIVCELGLSEPFYLSKMCYKVRNNVLQYQKSQKV